MAVAKTLPPPTSSRLMRSAGFLSLLLVPWAALSAHALESPPSEQSVTAEMNDAVEQVKRIVNEPVPALPRTPEAQVGEFSPGWFHEGAAKPNFLSVDVRKSQQFPYDRFEYVTSDLNPGLMFRGQDLEFNSMTKYFYTDRGVPKKRLGEAEMVEINRLYRIIGGCEQRLASLRNPVAAGGPGAPAAETGVARVAAPGSNVKYVVAGCLVLVLAAVLYSLRSGR